jgi:DNA-binding IclR family transcriptional regulator
MATPRSALLNTLEDSNRNAAGQYEVSSVRKALEILCSFTPARPAWTLSDLSRSLGIPKSTAHNLVRTLESFGCVRQNPDDRRYTLGPKIYELGLVFSHTTDLLTKAMPFLRKLAAETEETVKLGVLSEAQVLVVGAIESVHQLHTRGDVGGRWPLHSTSLGKAILACLEPDKVRDLLGSRRLPPLTPRTITRLDKLQTELEQIRERGYAIDWEENEPGVHCVAAGLIVPGHEVVAAISVSGPAVRIHEKILPGHAARVRETVAGIKVALGGRAR